MTELQDPHIHPTTIRKQKCKSTESLVVDAINGTQRTDDNLVWLTVMRRNKDHHAVPIALVFNKGNKSDFHTLRHEGSTNKGSRGPHYIVYKI